jgi:aminoglycoside 2''-phosphotransferase
MLALFSVDDYLGDPRHCPCATLKWINRLNLESLVAKVGAAFPDLAITQAELEDRGGDHHVLLVNRDYVFRFPRRANNNLPLEIAVLAALRDKGTVPVPDYEFVAPDLSFGGYRFLRGMELTRAVFAALDASAQEDILDQAIFLLNTLHALEPDEVAGDRTWRRIWTPREFTRRGRSRLAAVEHQFPGLAAEIETFYRVYERDEARSLAVLHGDLVEEHLLLGADQQTLAGVIDFGDVGLGDPADDLKGFWAYGEAAANYVISKVTQNCADPNLTARSNRAYLRYCIDRFMEEVEEDGSQSAEQKADRLLRRLIDASDRPN